MACAHLYVMCVCILRNNHSIVFRIHTFIVTMIILLCDVVGFRGDDDVVSKTLNEITRITSSSYGITSSSAGRTDMHA